MAGITVRNDTGVAEGGEISIFYDPMIAKLVVHGPDRKAAIDHTALALDEFYIEGIQHNVPFLAAIMQHKRWRAGDLSTNFIAEEYPDGFELRPPDKKERDLLAIVAAAIDHAGNNRRREISQQMEGKEFHFALERVVSIGGEMKTLRITDGEGSRIEIALLDNKGKAGKPVEVETDWWFGDPVWMGRIGGEEVAVQVKPILNGYELAHRGLHLPAYVYTLREAELAALMLYKEPPDTSKMLLCPMPGLVVSIGVEPGQQVKAGDALCVVEAMKMENILRAQRDAMVEEIAVSPGDSLAVDAVIMTFV